MKNLSLYLMILAPIVGFGQSQNKKIQELWSTIQQQEQNAEVKSMLPNILEVKSLSKKAKDYPSLIKAMFFEAKIAILTKEDKEYDIDQIVKQFEAESKATKGVQKAVFETYTAMLYNLYFQANYYKIRNRTNLEDKQSTSIAFWTSADFTDKINKSFTNALNIAAQNKTAEIGVWGDVFVKEQASKLDWNKLSFYNIVRLEYLNYLSEFSNRNREGKEDMLAKQSELEKELLADLKSSKQTSLYLYVKLFLLSNSTENNEAKKATCLALLKEYPTEAIVYDGYANYVEGVELVALADQVQKLFPNTATATRLANLKKDAQQSKATFKIKGYVSDGESIPLYVSHSNNDKVYVQILRIEDENKAIDVYRLNGVENYLDVAKKYAVTSTYSVDLKAFDDYKFHNTIAALQPLTSGRYYVVLSNTAFDNLKKGESDIQVLALNVTSNVIVVGESKIRAYNRKTGLPLTNTDIVISNGPIRSNAKTYWETVAKTDGNGEYVFDFVKDSGNLFFNVKGDNVYYSKWVYNSPKDATDEAAESTLSGVVMTDRAIYRPGQVLYFKTILTQHKANKEYVGVNKPIVALLKNNNNDEVAKLALTTNDFGSANGQFVLPTGGLLGDYYLEIKAGDNSVAQSNVSVEEYKRPKFSVTVEKPKGIYTLDDEVSVVGNAKAFFGGTLNQAKVVYRVERREEWPYWLWRGLAPYHYSEPVTMVQGETVTDEKGDFKINFKALAAQPKTKENSPRTYRFDVYADVIDSNGETHSIAETVLVGDKNIELSVKLFNNVEVKDLAKIKVETTNLNGVEYPAKGELAIYALEKPYAARLLDNTEYAQTDYELYDYASFVKKMPYTVYANELDTALWKEGKQVFTSTFDTGKTKEILFEGAKQLPSGSYVVKGFVFENGEKTEVKKIIHLTNAQITTSTVELVELSTADKKYKSGEKVRIQLRAVEDNTAAIVEVVANGKKVQQKTITIGKKAILFDVPVKKEYTILNVNVAVVKHGISKVIDHSVQLESDNSDLKVTIESFRDKIEPGAKEKWSIKIAGDKKEQAVAEVLATMYDASLDQFRSNQLTNRLKEPVYYENSPTFSSYSFSSLQQIQYPVRIERIQTLGQNLDFYSPVQFNLFDFGFRTRHAYLRSARGGALESKVLGMSLQSDNTNPGPPPADKEGDFDSGVINVDALNSTRDNMATEQEQGPTNATLSVRKNLRETAFFYPTLRTDENGNVKVEFTMPEALTQWKFMAFAHTKDLQQGMVEQLVQTQKELMVVPNLPRFLREGDQVILSSKIVNLSTKARKGKATLQIHNASTNELMLEKAVPFDVVSGGSTAVNWDVIVPKDVQAITCRIVANDGEYSDGEESVLAVLSNRMLVTETMPIFIKEGQNKIFTFDKYEKEHSNTTENYKLTLELTTSPIWNAIFALPSLKESNSNNMEQLFSQVFANAVATQILNANPKIKTVFDQWGANDELVSKLDQNEELKSILIAETPWVREAQTETEQMKRMAVLFDLNKMRTELVATIEKLEEQQNTDGGFAWYSGGMSDQYITQTIVEGFGDLKKMGVLDAEWMKELNVDYTAIIKKALNFMDEREYANFATRSSTKKESDQPILAMHYMYARSFFLTDFGINEKYAPMITSMRNSIEKGKVEGSLYQQAMRATVAKRFGFTKAAQSVMKYIMEASVSSEVDGMYWKANQAGWLWYQSPVDVQAMIIEAANEVDSAMYEKEIEEMKVWLMKNKQTSSWNSTKATTKAVYALLTTGKSWIDAVGGIDVKVGGYPVDVTKDAQFGSGYIKQSWTKNEMTPKKGIVEISKTSPGISFGAMYWQYFEDLDAITTSNSEIQMKKELFLKVNTDKGQALKAITANTPIKVGDVVTVRLMLTVDRDMNYVHLKDMRASGFEPMNVMSGYRWKGEFGYYEETRDAATNFFISRLPKGNYVFEYDVRANTAGMFSNGITTLQNMYAPEMNAHSEGIKVNIKQE